jgi:hypothetical protein
MALADLTDPTAVLKAIQEADSLGRRRFLLKYRFGRSREYFLQHEGRLYDSKAIVGAAYGYQHPAAGPLMRDDFSGGEQTVQRRLEQLGFTVVVSPRMLKPSSILEATEWDLSPSDKIRRVDLHERYGGGVWGQPLGVNSIRPPVSTRGASPQGTP